MIPQMSARHESRVTCSCTRGEGRPVTARHTEVTADDAARPRVLGHLMVLAAALMVETGSLGLKDACNPRSFDGGFIVEGEARSQR